MRRRPGQIDREGDVEIETNRYSNFFNEEFERAKRKKEGIDEGASEASRVLRENESQK